MYDILVRRFLYPLHERLLGRPTFRVLRDLERSQWLQPRQLRELQASKLTRLFRHVARTSKDYAQYFESHPMDPLREGPFDILGRLPLVDKRCIRRRVRAAGFIRRGRVRMMSTGGSTGEPLTFLVDTMRTAYDKAARMRTHRWFGVQPGDREAYLWGAPIDGKREDRLRAIRNRILNDLLLSAFDLNPATTRRYLRRMGAFNPRCVFGYPSSLVLFCDLARRAGLQPELPSLRAVFVTGEVLDRLQRSTLEEFFGVPVANGYGGRDSGFCAHQCPRGRMHVTTEHVVMEIVGPDGQVMPTGESGEIVITNLDNYATPFIRYRTGDIGRLLGEECPCGRGLEVMDVVAGRRTDHLVAADGTLRHALSLIYLLRDTRGIDQFQIRQRRDRSIDVRVVAPEGFEHQTRMKVLRGIRDCLGESLDAELRVVDSIETQASGKFRHVISEAGGES